MLSTALRLIDTLALVPRRAPGVTAAGLVEALAGRGWDVHVRTLQRDLRDLATRFPLTATGKPLQWHWMQGARPISLPGTDVAGAVIWRLIDEHLKSLLPPVLRQEMAGQIEAAELALERSGAPLAGWIRRVARVPASMEPVPPGIDESVFATVAECLVARRRLSATYRPRYESEARGYEVNPLGIVARGPVTYLVATIAEYSNPVHLALHRMTQASALSRPAVDPPGFDFGAYVRGPAFGYPVGPMIRLRAFFTEDAAFHLSESSIAPDQRIRRLADDRYELNATVSDSLQLRWWLRAFGDHVEVASPKRLRKEFMDTLQQTLTRYGSR